MLGCFPHVSPQTLLRLCCPLLSSLSCCRHRAAAIRAANDANGLNAARSISSYAAKAAAAPPSVLSNNLALFMAFSYYPRVIFYATHCGHFPACRKYFDSRRTRERRRRQAGRQAGRSRLLGLANLTGAFDTKLTFYKLVSQVKATPAAAAA